MQYKAARRRAQSDAAEIPFVGDTLTESFPIEVEFRGIRFSAVKMFHPRKGLFILWVCSLIKTILQSAWA